MEIWSADKPDNLALTRWLDRLRQADADRFTHWIIHNQGDLLRYYLYRNTELFIREYEQDPAEVGSDYFSEDDTHFVRLRKMADADPHIAAFEADRDTLVLDLLKRMALYDFRVYQAILLESSVVLPAEEEEELLRLRNIRLAEKGFLPFDEAIGIYQPLTVKDLLNRRYNGAATGGRRVESYPSFIESGAIPEQADLFTQILAKIQDEAVQHRLQTEFAGLCNQVVAADQKKVREKLDLSQVVAKVSGYISLGLEKTIAEAKADDPYAGANLLQNYLLADIFRVGYGCALSLKWKAEKWRQTSWFSQVGLPLGFWGEAWLGVLGGLLLKKPLFFDNFSTGVLYREFKSLEDVDRTGQILDDIIAFDQLLSLMSIELKDMTIHRFLTYANLLLTLWADHYLGMDGESNTPQPLTMNEFRQFFKELWASQTPPRRISTSMREIFLDWLADRSGLATYEIAERIGSSLESLFASIESELGDVALKDLDPRYIYLFLFK
jgi:hypothetical protein